MISIQKKLMFLCVCFMGILINISHANTQPLPIITHQEEIDLELFESQSPDSKSLFEILDRTVTAKGREALKALLKNPLTDPTLLEQRKQIIKYIIENPEILEHLDKALQVFKKHEQTLDNFWQPQDSICKTTLENFYFTNKHLTRLNESPKHLNLLQITHTLSLFAPIIEHAVLHWLISDKIKSKYHIGCGHDHSHDHDHENWGTTAKVLYNIYWYAHWAVHLYGLKTVYDHIKQKLTVSKELQSQVISANKCLESLKTIYTVTKDHSSISQKLVSFNKLETLFTATEKQSTQLQTIMAKDTFQGNPSLMSNVGNILAAHKEIKDATIFHQALQALGEIDAYVSIAKLYKEHSDHEACYSFAQYAASDKPHLEAVEFWNPYIGSQTCSTNNLELGIHNPNTIIITGPNLAGKSTNLKSLALIVLLGQTFTIVPATHACFTPFAKITTSIKHSDNTQEGTSLFTAELIKANDFIDMLQNKLSSSQFSFVIFDELFKSTSYEKGQETAYNLIKYLGKFKNNMCIVSTHFPKLTTLESADSSLFINYTATTTKDTKNQTHFVLKEGSSSASQSFDVLEEQGIQGIWNS